MKDRTSTCGANRDRTNDLQIFSLTLSQLSYSTFMSMNVYKAI